MKRTDLVDTLMAKLAASRAETRRLEQQVRDMRGSHTRQHMAMCQRLRAESDRADRAEEAARRLADAAARSLAA